MKKKTLFAAKCAAFGAFLITAAAILGLLDTYTHTDMQPLYLTPLLQDSRGWDIYTVENGTPKPLAPDELTEMGRGKTYFLSRLLTREQEENGYTFLRLSSQLPCAVFLDEQLLYTTCPDSVFSIDQISFPDEYDGLSGRGEAVRCTLPAHFAGRKLTIATKTDNSGYGPFIPSVILSSEAIESENATASTSHEMIPAAGFAVMALLLMIAWLFAFLQRVYNYQLLLPIIAALLQSFSHLRQLSFLSAAFTALDSPFAQFIPAASLLLPLLYLLLQMKEKRNRILFGCILGISSAAALLSPAAVFFGGLPFDSLLLTENRSFYLPAAALLIFSVREARHGNTELRFFLSGLGITVSYIAILYIGSLFGKGYYANYILTVFKSMLADAPSEFWNWCSIILFLFSALISLHKIIRHMVRVHTDLSLQTERAKQLDRQLAVQKDFYDARLLHEKEIRSLRHDMDGHLNTLSVLLRDDRLTEAKNYLDGIASYHHEQTSEIFSENPYVNAVLQNYSAKCLTHHIELVCRIGIGDCDLPATELCLILNNAFENALDASLALPEEERKIKVQAAVHQSMFLLRVSNRFHGDVETADGLPVTTKRGKEHGYGLFNIRQAAERRGGSMEYRVENGYFVLDVRFPVS